MAERKSIRLSDRRRQYLANEIAKTACVQEQKPGLGRPGRSAERYCDRWV
jgi:hypothetical protein